MRFPPPLVWVLFLSARANPAQAEPPASCTDEAQARARFQEGVKAVRVDNYPSALDAFEDAYRLCPMPTTLFNLAMAHKALYHLVRASELLKRYLAQTEEGMASNTRAQARAALAEMAPLLGKLAVFTVPPGAELSVDGRVAAKSPWTEPIPLDPGEHALRLTCPGYEPYEVTLKVRSGETAALDSSRLRPKEARIRVDCQPPGELLLGHRRLGSCPYDGPIPPGSSVLVLRAADGRETSRSLELGPGQETELRLEVPEPAARPPVPPAPTTPRTPTDETSGASATRLLLGYGALGLSAASLTYGIYSSYQWTVHDRQVRDAKAAAVAAPSEAEYETELAAYREVRDRVTEKDHPRDVVGMAVGYGLATALAIGGVVLLIRTPDSAKVALSPSRIEIGLAF